MHIYNNNNPLFLGVLYIQCRYLPRIFYLLETNLVKILYFYLCYIIHNAIANEYVFIPFTPVRNSSNAVF